MGPEETQLDIEQLQRSQRHDIYWLLYHTLQMSPSEIDGKPYTQLYWMLNEEIKKLKQQPTGNWFDEVLLKQQSKVEQTFTQRTKDRK